MPGPQASVPAGMGAVGVFSGPFSVCPGTFLISHSYGHCKCLGVVALVDGWPFQHVPLFASAPTP